ncbi:glycerate kinase [Allobaculum sp. JKK-2023]|uniref:glycerate kinase family protein n=1 Tax=Allobaculum sp. JKK-2023 TaxID=3108943 RepID=UPI002B05EFBC|nr:glycerate kinase [Allobaculum sp. JKK-2023]
MKVLIASDSFKGCMTSQEANRHIESGIKRADPSIECFSFPISDGGEGMVDAFAFAYHAQVIETRTEDLYHRPIWVRWAYCEEKQIACIEAASVVGLTLYNHGQRHPLDTSSYGLGLLCKEVLRRKKVRQLIIGLGGTGSNDGGMGFLSAFGAVFYDKYRQVLEPCTRSLSKIAFIDKRNFNPPRHVRLIAACDVNNPLLGPQGATWIFGRQKGLTLAQQEMVEAGMEKLNAKIDQTFHVNMNDFMGAGAAGGLGGMLIGVFRAHMVSGMEVLEDGDLKRALQECDFIFTGEGQTDSQSADGKVVSRLAAWAREYEIPMVVISGALGPGYERLYDQGVDAMFSTADRAMSFAYALRHGPQKLEQETWNLMRLILAARRTMKK